jgi:hypothetical protein
MVILRKFTVYNKLYKNGRAVGGKYKYATIEARNATEAVKMVDKHNAKWNSQSSNTRDGFKAGTYDVKEVVKRKAPTTRRRTQSFGFPRSFRF